MPSTSHGTPSSAAGTPTSTIASTSRIVFWGIVTSLASTALWHLGRWGLQLERRYESR